MTSEYNAKAWQFNSKDEIVDYIISEFHCNHRVQLADLLALSVDLGNSLSPRGFWPIEFHAVLLKLYEDLLEHMQREEQILFPLILSNEFGRLYNEKGLALHNHDHHLHMLDHLAAMSAELDHIKHADVIGADTRESLMEFQGLLAHFSAELRRHIELENDYLFNE